MTDGRSSVSRCLELAGAAAHTCASLSASLERLDQVGLRGSDQGRLTAQMLALAESVHELAGVVAERAASDLVPVCFEAELEPGAHCIVRKDVQIPLRVVDLFAELPPGVRVSQARVGTMNLLADPGLSALAFRSGLAVELARHVAVPGVTLALELFNDGPNRASVQAVIRCRVVL